MNDILTTVILIFSVLAAIDYIFGGKLGLGKEFVKGFMLLGTMALSMIGMILLAPLIAELLSPVLSKIPDDFFFDPSMISGWFLANDMGGAPLSLEIAKSPLVGNFNGLVVGSMMGATLSFTLPFALSVTQKAQHKSILLGLLCGIIAMPIGCIVSGVMLKLSISELVSNIVPLIIFAGILAVGLLKIPEVCLKIFKVFGIIIKSLIVVGLISGIIEFITGFKLLPHTAPIQEGADIIFNAAVIMSGSFPMVFVLGKILAKPAEKIGSKIGINAPSAIGIISNLASCALVYTDMEKLNEKGVVLNAAFSVSGAFALAGHLAFTLSFEPSFLVPVVVGKLVSAVAALFVANFLFEYLVKKGKI